MIGLVIAKTFWLLATNVLLGLAVIALCVSIVWYLMRDMIRHRKEKKEESLVPPDYLKGLEYLGVTMPDGAEKIDEMKEQ
jgi:hypothetical protein